MYFFLLLPIRHPGLLSRSASGLGGRIGLEGEFEFRRAFEFDLNDARREEVPGRASTKVRVKSGFLVLFNLIHGNKT